MFVSKHIVFTIHGMGTHKTGWSKPAVKALKANALSIGYPLKLSSDFEFIEINYNHLFQEYLDPVSYTHLTLPTILLV